MFLQILLETVLKLLFQFIIPNYFVNGTFLSLQDPKINISTKVSITTVIRVLFVVGCFDSKPYSMVLPKEGVCTFCENQSEVAATDMRADRHIYAIHKYEFERMVYLGLRELYIHL